MKKIFLVVGLTALFVPASWGAYTITGTECPMHAWVLYKSQLPEPSPPYTVLQEGWPEYQETEDEDGWNWQCEWMFHANPAVWDVYHFFTRPDFWPTVGTATKKYTFHRRAVFCHAELQFEYRIDTVDSNGKITKGDWADVDTDDIDVTVLSPDGLDSGDSGDTDCEVEYEIGIPVTSTSKVVFLRATVWTCAEFWDDPHDTDYVSTRFDADIRDFPED